MTQLESEIQVRMDGVSRKYGEHWAVRDLSLELRKGELFAFLGPNGAGKTTTIKMICGLLRPTAGTITICGHDLVADGLAARANLSYVPDLPFLYEHLTGLEFLQLVAQLHGLAPEKAMERISTVTRQFELEKFRDQITMRYSHGMRQRTVFAAALLHQPKVLVVDEPTVGLDPRSVRQLKDLLRELVAEGTTIFLSSHSLDVVQELADRIGIISGGKLIGCGSIGELSSQASHDGPLEEVFLKLTSEDEPGTGP
ncbi:MAG: ABC transporter ATP-binding protein [Planctomycetota bacterium]